MTSVNVVKMAHVSLKKNGIEVKVLDVGGKPLKFPVVNAGFENEPLPLEEKPR